VKRERQKLFNREIDFPSPTIRVPKLKNRFAERGRQVREKDRSLNFQSRIDRMTREDTDIGDEKTGINESAKQAEYAKVGILTKMEVADS
jgi:hypothetical protein